MNTFVISLFIFLLANLAVTIPMVRTLVRSRRAGASGGELLKTLLPYLILDIILVLAFALWLVFG